MSGWKGGGILLILAIPLAFYAAWQIKGVVRPDMVVSDPPPDRGGTKEQLAATKAKTAAWAGDARKASTVALQYRQPDAGDTPSDAGAAEVVKRAAERTADLKDLDHFLTRVENVKFLGKLKDDYAGWKDEVDKAHKNEKLVLDRLAKPLTVTSKDAAAAEVAEVERLITQYTSQSSFASPRQAALWRVRAHLKVIKELSALADSEYPKAMAVTLPIKSDNNAMNTALATIREVKAQDLALRGALKRAEEEGAELTDQLRTDRAERAKEVANCSAREKLLALFARDDLFTNAEGAAAWLKDVSALYRETTDLTDRRHIYKKVQEFCEAFLPAAARLDDLVGFKKDTVQRENLVVEYEPAAGAAAVRVKLSDSLDGLNEINISKMLAGKSVEIRHQGTPGLPRDLTPTPLSRAAETYNTARKEVAAGVAGPKWTAKTVESLKSKCEKEKNLVDQLKLLRPKDEKPSDKKDDKELRLWVRMEGLLEGLKACADWIETAP